MVVEIASKDELQSVAEKLKNVTSQLTTETVDMIGKLSDAEDIDKINISRAAAVIQNNLKSISGEVETLASRLSNYITDIKNLDTYDLQVDEKI